MPSEQRLHPATLLFEIAKHLRRFAIPAVLVLFGASRSSGGPGGTFGRIPAGWEVWLLVLFVPAVAASIVRYLTFRLQYEPHELILRSGLLFRNERHVPFAKIQNLDAVQNVLHRLLGVVEIRVETGGGKDEEARLSVLPRAAFDEMRRRVFEGRADPAAATTSEAVSRQPDAEGHTLLHLPVRELLLCGFLENKGMILIGAAYGVAWESGLLGGLWNRVFGDETASRGFFRDLGRGFAEGQGVPLPAIAAGLVMLAVLLLVVRVVSMAWAVLRLYDFRLTRVREDLRIEFGLLTRIAATIPIRRVQTITIRQGPIHRWLSRASVRVETAGGGADPKSAGPRDREWLAPLIGVAALPGLLDQVVPGFDVTAVAWQPVHPRAFRRAVKPRLAFAAIVAVSWALTVGPGTILVLMLLLAWAVIGARQYVRHLQWAEHDEVVLMRSGWIWRQETLARVNKIQSVTVRQSPLDRRAAMARVRVDTAGAGAASHRVDIPYLDQIAAAGLAGRLASQAASTAFRW